MTRVPPPLDPALIAQRPVATEDIVTPSQLEWLFTCCAADAQFFEEASNLIQAHHFRADEVVYRIVWEGIARCYERYNGVDYMSLAYEVGGYLQRDAMVRLTPEQHYELFAQDGGFLAALTSQTDVSAVQFELGRAHLRQFAHERSIIAPLRRMVASGHTAGVPGDMTDMIKATSERLAMISTTQVVPLAEIAPEFGTTMAPSSIFRSTGVAWIDGPLGGQRVGDANGLIGPTGGGKAQPLSASVMTPAGPKRMGDMCVGDMVCTPDGGTAAVRGVFPQGELAVYEIVFSDGSTVKCCDDHLWKIDSSTNGWQGKVKSLREIRETYLAATGRAKYSISVTAPVNFATRDVPFDPYLLGVLLGDGGLTSGTPVISNPEPEILQAFTASGQYELRRRTADGCDYRIVAVGAEKHAGGKQNPLKSILRDFNLDGKRSYEKEIPDCYLYNDVATRWAVLQGLMDTDGYASLYPGSDTKSRLEYTTTSPQLRDQFIWLVQSLGGLATVSVKKTKKYRDAYRICVKFDDPSQCFRLPRKQNKCRTRAKYPVKRVIKDIRLVGREACQCIAVDHPDQLYLTDHFIVTHNTTLGIHMACAAAKQAWTEMQRDPSQQYRVVFVTAEESADKLRPRIWSNFFEMRRADLEGDVNWDGFSRQGSLKEYEVRRQHGQEHMLSEYDRYMMHAESCNKVLKVLDTSGSDKYPNAGGGFIAEIASYLARMQQENVGFWSVFIDYAGLVVERYLQAKGLNHDEYRTLLKTFGDRCRKEISERFQTTTWILHQLKGQEGSASPTKLQSHVGAGESRDFANNMAICGCLGTEHKATGCRFLNWSKIRYRPGVVMPPVVLRIGDEIAEMECVTDRFVPSLAGGAFMPRAEANAVQGSSNDLQPRRVDADIAEVEV